MSPALASCIKENAAKVEEAIESLKEATDFLIGSVCAEQLAAQVVAELKKKSEKRAAELREVCDAQKKNPVKATDSGENSDWCQYLDAKVFTQDPADYAGPVSASQASAAAVSLAAKTMLDLRLARNKSSRDPR